MTKLPIDTCDRCGSTTAPLQIIFKPLRGFEALCLACKKEHWQHEKQTLDRNTRPSHSSRTAGTGPVQNLRKN